MTDFIMQDSNDIYSFKEIPQLDAYGTKDHM